MAKTLLKRLLLVLLVLRSLQLRESGYYLNGFLTELEVLTEISYIIRTSCP